MRSIVPFAATEPKSRLDSVLTTDERAAFARVMLRSVLSTLRDAGHKPTVLATAPLDETTLPAETPVVVDDQPLTAAVNDQLAAAESPTLIVMADLPLATPDTIGRLTAASDDAGDDADIAIAPGLGGGTNALVVRDPAFRVDYHGASYLDHRAAAVDCGATVQTVDSRQLATDIDEPSDFAEVLIHGDGAARVWLDDAGFELDTSGGRVGVRRR
ncbi:2-phospho-L-lactate guanylyltransferase [Halonotius terrestris]|uniref:2-phospho-L-lactate guanylyltransferase n=1 Tax=Halonotius terrestris TaxID=2487750 RepID=A0A8J8P8R4_9EURY|nr:2-phospho-L-lactate guanylyltransferase [Halonotius terrestris]TQQ81094.1 2-phospho-L-lactate guanylyltransferase [Halonotius terrestris]